MEKDKGPAIKLPLILSLARITYNFYLESYVNPLSNSFLDNYTY